MIKKLLAENQRLENTVKKNPKEIVNKFTRYQIKYASLYNGCPTKVDHKANQYAYKHTLEWIYQ